MACVEEQDIWKYIHYQRYCERMYKIQYAVERGDTTYIWGPVVFTTKWASSINIVVPMTE